MTITEEQRGLAIDMLKDGRPPEAVHARLVELGIANDEVYAFVSELVRLKSEVAARDPARLREEAKWILLRRSRRITRPRRQARDGSALAAV